MNTLLDPEYDRLGRIIIGASFEVRRNTGRGLKEKYYEAALVWELRQHGLNVLRQQPISVTYKGVVVDESFVADIVVEGKIIIEMKSLKSVTEEEVRQLYTYLRLSDCRLGYLINFGANDFCTGNLKRESHPYIHGIYRVVNDRPFRGFSP